jgi:hypothetical protein
MRVNTSEMDNSKELAEKKIVSPAETAPASKKRCRIDGKTMIWIDQDADEKETIEKYLVDRKNSYHG